MTKFFLKIRWRYKKPAFKNYFCVDKYDSCFVALGLNLYLSFQVKHYLIRKWLRTRRTYGRSVNEYVHWLLDNFTLVLYMKEGINVGKY